MLQPRRSHLFETTEADSNIERPVLTGSTCLGMPGVSELPASLPSLMYNSYSVSLNQPGSRLTWGLH
jgi:hypothetical protein